VRVIIGEQDSDKIWFFSDVLSKLSGLYAISTKNNISSIMSRFVNDRFAKLLSQFDSIPK
jgi:hypothetical protein